MLRMAKAPEREKLAYHTEAEWYASWPKDEWQDDTEAYWYDEETEVWHGSKYDFYDDYDEIKGWVIGAREDLESQRCRCTRLPPRAPAKSSATRDTAVHNTVHQVRARFQSA